MNIKAFYDWTPINHGDFLAGLITGMKMIDSTQPYIEEVVTTKPVGINGRGGLGIVISTELVGEDNIAIVSIYTKNVEAKTSYGMFSLTMTWDANRGSVYRLIDGDFGDFGEHMTSTQSSGRLNVIGQRLDGIQYSEPQVLFQVAFRVSGVIDETNPIALNIASTSNYNDAQDCIDNYSTLLQMREEIWGFIAPLDNISGAIVSDKERVVDNIDDGDGLNAKASPSMIAMGSSFTGLGEIGMVPIWINVNKEDNFSYNRFEYTLQINLADGAVDILELVALDGWDITTTISYDGDVIKVVVTGIINIAVDGGLSTVGYLMFKSNSNEYTKYIRLSDATLYNNTNSLSVITSDGLMYHGYGDSGGGPSYPTLGGNGSFGGGGGNGGTGIVGQIWSGTSQIIWVGINGGPKVPVQLKPGMNDINVYIPNIFPNEMFDPDLGQIQIESDDYIWIPAGFKIIKIPPEDTGKVMWILNYLDKFMGSEVFSIEMVRVEPPVDLDNIIDNIDGNDVMEMELRRVERKYDLDEIVDDIDSNDIMDIELRKVEKKYDLDGLTDEVKSNDIMDMDLIKYEEPVNMDEIIEDISSNDVMDMELRKVEIKYDADTIIDNIPSNDMVDMEIRHTERITGIDDLIEDISNIDRVDIQLNDIIIEYEDTTSRNSLLDEFYTTVYSKDESAVRDIIDGKGNKDRLEVEISKVLEEDLGLTDEELTKDCLEIISSHINKAIEVRDTNDTEHSSQLSDMYFDIELVKQPKRGEDNNDR